MEAPPLVEPDQELLDGYVIRLPFPMARRVEDGSLLFWHTPKRLTFWIDARRRDLAIDPLPGWIDRQSDAAYDIGIERSGSAIRYGSRLNEDDADDPQPAFHGFFAEGRTEFLLAAYFDRAEAFDDALSAWRSLRAAG
ncbi:hypothetical protein VQ02_04665 [Methylobacterium variabile]|jgi:hypothetical protein|uniref:Uncharacterized protein n=1 Tax=Methylobacterium variabile TaxID=298794 RepID=A0A0J6T7F1_9HYPH|nr:hypothetical protein [Methylobacterium variabile]KMO41812.1 hypothetical protein VQ02_04665 [Methylobacterium variabile]